MVAVREFVVGHRVALCGLFMAALAVVLVLGLPADSEALGCGYGWLFYSDWSKTQVVGAMFWYPQSCACEFVLWGVRTSISTYRSFSC